MTVLCCAVLGPRTPCEVALPSDFLSLLLFLLVVLAVCVCESHCPTPCCTVPQALHAARHRRRVLLVAAWVALQAEVQAGRLYRRLAAVQASKRAYLQLGSSLKVRAALGPSLEQERGV